MVGKRGSLEERFWPKVLKGTEEECWLWQATKNNKGYGMIQSLEYGRKILAHRASFILKNGAIDDKICVLHKCDTPACVNPNHLFLGTKLDNVRDMIEKGRKVIAWNPNNKPPVRFGSQHAESKLTEADVIEMRALMAKGATGREMGFKYGINRHTADRIKRRDSWRHI